MMVRWPRSLFRNGSDGGDGDVGLHSLQGLATAAVFQHFTVERDADPSTPLLKVRRSSCDFVSRRTGYGSLTRRPGVLAAAASSSNYPRMSVDVDVARGLAEGNLTNATTTTNMTNPGNVMQMTVPGECRLSWARPPTTPVGNNWRRPHQETLNPCLGLDLMQGP